MKLNDTLFARMRAARAALDKQGPLAATAAIQDALKVLQPSRGPAVQPPMRDVNPPPASGNGTTPLNDVMADLRQNLEQRFSGIQMPELDLPGARKRVNHWPGAFREASYTNSAGTRAYKLYVPANRSAQPAALIVMLHGCTQDPDDFAHGTQMNDLAEQTGCLVLYPAQSQQANASRCWNWFNAADQQRGQGEPSIIAGMTETIVREYDVDPAQVYVAGLSAGGAMAVIMGTLYPDLYAAVGVHSGLPFASAHDLPSALAAMKGQMKRPRAPGKPIPMIVFHGDKDTTVHPANADELVRQGTHTAKRNAQVEPGRVTNGHAFTRTVHQGADGKAHMEHWSIHGAGHAWSGGSPHGSYTDGRGPDASREMMRFFQTRR